MSSNEIPTHINKQIGNSFIKIPHVLILGAGACKASFQNGDFNGLTMPLMNDLVEVVGLNDLLKSSGIKYEDENFEAIFSHIIPLGQKIRCRIVIHSKKWLIGLLLCLMRKEKLQIKLEEEIS